MKTIHTIIILLLALVGSANAQGTGTITGVCSLPDTSDWGGITVSVLGQHKSTTTASNGSFTLSNVSAGSVRIQAGKLFYMNAVKETTLSAGQTINLSLSLTTTIVDTFYGQASSKFTTAVTNVGNLGVPNRFIEVGDSGFTWFGQQQLKEASLMMGTDTSRVSDAARFILGIAQDNQDHDFRSLSDIILVNSSSDSTVLVTAFDDSRSNLPPGYPSQPLEVLVTQTTYSYTTGNNAGALLVKLALKNQSRFTLQNFLAGWFVDWNVGNAAFTNRGGVITTVNQIEGVNNDAIFPIEVAYQKASTLSGPYMGIVPLSQAKFKAARIASHQREIIPNPPYGGFTEAAKYRYMNERRQSNRDADWGIEEDLSTIVSLGGLNAENYEQSSFTLAPSEEIIVGVAFVGGNDSLELLTNAVNAQRKWVQLGNTITVLPNIWTVTALWNLLSLPVTPSDPRKSSVFPTSTTFAFAYVPGAGYVAVDTLKGGVGYWLRFATAQKVTINGDLRLLDTITVDSGWNLIGTLTYPLSTSSIITEPPKIISSRFFEFSEGYVASDTLYPLRGYWVKTRQQGIIILQRSE
jgi:hypothetical protein